MNSEVAGVIGSVRRGECKEGQALPSHPERRARGDARSRAGVPRVMTTLGMAVCAAVGAQAQDIGQAVDLERIVVTATRSEQTLEQVPASVAVRDMADLRDNGFLSGTDEFRAVTGVFFRRGEGDSDEFPYVSIRGSTGTEGFLVLVDGLAQIGMFEEAQLNELPYDAIERVEIIKGPVSALYGRGALYGAVNYITRTPGEGDSQLALTLGSDGHVRGEGVLSQALSDRAGLLLAGSYTDDDGWREHSRRQIASLSAKLRLDVDERNRVLLSATHTQRDNQIPNGLPLDAQGRVLDVHGGAQGFLGYGQPRSEAVISSLGLRLEHESSDAVAVAFNLQARRLDRDNLLNFYDPYGLDVTRGVMGFNGFRSDTLHDALVGETTLNWRAGRHNLLFGLSGELAAIEEDNYWSGQNGFTPECGFTYFLIEVDYRSGRPTNIDHPCFVQDVKNRQSEFKNAFWGVFLQDEITLSDAWVLTLGGRYDWFRRRIDFAALPGVGEGGSARGEADAFSPKATVSYRPQWGQVYLSYGRGFNSNFGATFEWDPATYERPESRPTTIDSYEIGIKGHAWQRRFSYAASAFLSRQKNRRVVIPNPAAATDVTAPIYLVTFGDRYESQGVELSTILRPMSGMRIEAGYTFTDAKWQEYVIPGSFGPPLDLSGNQPTGVPRHMAYLSWDQQLNNWLSLRATYEHYDDYMITGNNRVRGGGYDLLTLGAQVSPESWGRATLNVAMTNALDEQYYFYLGGNSAPTYATPGPPRQVRATLRYTF